MRRVEGFLVMTVFTPEPYALPDVRLLGPGVEFPLEGIEFNGFRLFESYTQAKKAFQTIKREKRSQIEIKYLKMIIPETREEVETLKTYEGEMVIFADFKGAKDTFFTHRLYGKDTIGTAVGSVPLSLNGLIPYNNRPNQIYGELLTRWLLLWKCSEVGRQVQVWSTIATFRLISLPKEDPKQLKLFQRI